MATHIFKIIFALLLSLLSATFLDLSAQTEGAANDSCDYIVEGYVYDLSSQEPIPYASVQLKGSSKGQVTDFQGYFKISQICDEEFDLIVSHLGYKQVTHHHDTYHEIPNIFLAPDSVTLQSVIIEGGSLPGELYSGTVKALSKQDFEFAQTENLGDLAANLSGVSTLKTGQNVAKPIIHGLHSNRVLIVNNGVRHEFQNWGAEHAPEIDPSMAESISVVKGAATVRYGPDALGGVLVIHPGNMDLLTPLNGEASVTAKSNGRSVDSHLQINKGFHKLALKAQASYVVQGDLNTPDYLLSNTSKRELSTSLGVRYHWRYFDIFADYSHFEQNLGILRGSVTGSLSDLAEAIQSDTPSETEEFDYTINNPRQTVQHDVFKIRSLYNGENQSVEATYAIQFNHRQEFDVRRGTNNERPAIDLELLTQTLDIEWDHPEIKKWNGKIGLQALYQDNNNLPGTNTVPFIPNYNNSRIGLYLIENSTLNEMRLEWGLRYDYQYTSVRGRKPNNDIYRNTLSFQNVTATVGLVAPLPNGHVFRTNLGSAWRPPNVSELYSFGKHSASIEYGYWRYRFLENQQISTDEILTENDRAAPSEMGLKWINTYEINNELFQAEFTTYLNFIRNYIYTKPAGITQTVRGAFPYFIYDQDDALFAGIDASFMMKHSKKASSEIQASFLWARDITNHEYFVGLPPANIRYQYRQQLPDFSILDNQNIQLRLNYTFSQVFAPRVVPITEILNAKNQGIDIFSENDADFDILSPPSAYFLADIYYQAEVSPFIFSLQVRNLLNTTYRNYTDRLRYFADEQGRNFMLSLKYNF